MLVILRENIEALGKTGDLVKVADGFARNYLLPRSKVFVADQKNLAAFEHEKRFLEKKSLAEKAAAMDFAQRLNGVKLLLTRKVSDKDKLFGSVSTADIADALSAAGFSLDKKTIILDAPLRQLGTFTVQVRLDADHSSQIEVTIAAEA